MSVLCLVFYANATQPLILNHDSLRDIYKAVVLAKLFYASPAWWGFTMASNRQRIDAFVHRGSRLRLYSAGDPAPTQMNDSADGALFERILHNRNQRLTSTVTWPQHTLRHDRISPSRTASVQDNNFLLRQPVQRHIGLLTLNKHLHLYNDKCISRYFFLYYVTSSCTLYFITLCTKMRFTIF